MKKAEALSYLGDDEGVLEVFAAAEHDGELGEEPKDALLLHLAAVATLRGRDEAAAHELWAEVLVPILLDRGDPQGREFALGLARALKTPKMLEALRDFALGQRGSDELRAQAAQVVSEAGLFEDHTARLWLGGEWREMLLQEI